MRSFHLIRHCLAAVSLAILTSHMAYCEETLEVWVDGKLALRTDRVTVEDSFGGQVTVKGEFNKNDLYYVSRDEPGNLDIRLKGKTVATRKPHKTIENGFLEFTMPSPVGGAKILQQEINLASGETPYDSKFVYVGSLEDVPPSSEGDTTSFWIVPCFRKSDSKWYPLKDSEKAFPEQATWTIAYDGRSLGDLKVDAPLMEGRGGARGYRLSPTQKVPSIGKKDMANSGFLFKETRRTLVAVSKPNFKDPDHWVSVKDTNKVRAVIVKEYRKLFSKVENCKTSESASKTWAYSDKDIQLSKQYRSAKGALIITAQLTGNRCDGIYIGPFEPQVFYQNSEGKTRHLGEGLILLDAGDYDSDGESELIFRVDRYNRGGYVLFSRGLSERTEKIYSFH